MDKKKNLFGYGIAVGAGILFLLLALLYGREQIRLRDLHNAEFTREKESKREEPESTRETGESSGFYGKLKSGEPVRLWVFGDLTAYPYLPDGENWTELLSSHIEEEYGSSVDLRNAALPGGNDALSHYTLLQNMLNEGERPDAVLLCMGYQEDPFNFPLYYEAILRSLYIRAPESSVLSLIESTALTSPEGKADELASVNRQLTEHYRGKSISLAMAFAVSREDYETLIGGADQRTLTEKGQELYASWIMDSIKEEVESQPAEETEKGEISLKNGAAAVFDQYSYIPREYFQRITDRDWQISVEKLRKMSAETTGTVALDYSLVLGRNDVNISIDGQLFGGYGIDYAVLESESLRIDAAGAARRVELINNNANLTDYLSVSFGSPEQAEQFHGLIFFGNLSFVEGNGNYSSLAIPEKQLDRELSEGEVIIGESPLGAEGTESMESAENLESGESVEGAEATESSETIVSSEVEESTGSRESTEGGEAAAGSGEGKTKSVETGALETAEAAAATEEETEVAVETETGSETEMGNEVANDTENISSEEIPVLSPEGES